MRRMVYPLALRYNLIVHYNDYRDLGDVHCHSDRNRYNLGVVLRRML